MERLLRVALTVNEPKDLFSWAVAQIPKESPPGTEHLPLIGILEFRKNEFYATVASESGGGYGCILYFMERDAKDAAEVLRKQELADDQLVICANIPNLATGEKSRCRLGDVIEHLSSMSGE